ncbi:MAG: hypothetical protein F4Y20_10895 [Acidobacteria bacterium]|nr:hypothetical protein [Acidobacteriota bacterium]MYH22745.1 hypothetical protein [Acidobacteriota bacterium]MYK80840.1 hypothetical protein [Acidobacteriota bacterium]
MIEALHVLSNDAIYRPMLKWESQTPVSFGKREWPAPIRGVRTRILGQRGLETMAMSSSGLTLAGLGSFGQGPLSPPAELAWQRKPAAVDAQYTADRRVLYVYKLLSDPSHDYDTFAFTPLNIERVVLPHKSVSVSHVSPWLKGVLEDLTDVENGVDVYGPVPPCAVVDEARRLLETLSEWVHAMPAVDDDALGGVSIEFYGRRGCRLLILIREDSSFTYRELVDGIHKSEDFQNRHELLEAHGVEAFQRVGVPVSGGFTVHYQTY